MGQNVARKILAEHLVEGEMVPGREIALKIDQTLTQDATGTMAYLQFEAMGVPRVRTKLSVSYIDHQTLQTGFENADDHAFLQSMAEKYGIYFSRPGNGICHQVHFERFAAPGQTLLGSDSHTPTAGGLGMIAIGAGGLDVAAAMAGQPFYTRMPKIVLVNLTGELQPWVTAKDIILEVLRILTVKGGVGKIIEYGGPGVKTLTATQRGTIANMGAELGATTSVFPSDEQTLEYLRAQGREDVWVRIESDADADYDETIEIDLDKLEPLIASPHSPDNVVPVREVEGTKVDQVAIGSCTNSSYQDLMTVAAILKGRTVYPQTSLVISPGSRQVLEMISRTEALGDIIASGARLLEVTCGPCIGMGQSPRWGGVTVRTFNRNFPGRSGTPNAEVYLSSPEVAVAAAISGEITDPRRLGEPISVEAPKRFHIDDRMIIQPKADTEDVEIIRGPNIKPLPTRGPMEDVLRGKVLIKVENNISTDAIMPAGSKVLPLRSNIPAISEYVFSSIEPEFAERAKREGGGFVVGGENYGQGSSREHAALAPMYLGVKSVLVKSFARIHRENLINFGILPLTFVDASDYDSLNPGDELEISDSRSAVRSDSPELTVRNKTSNKDFTARHDLTNRQVEIMVAGGMLNYIKATG